MNEMTFVRILLGDVSEAHARLQANDTQTARRDLIRALFAAIEGMAWLYRQFVRESLRKAQLLEFKEDQALSETIFFGR